MKEKIFMSIIIGFLTGVGIFSFITLSLPLILLCSLVFGSIYLTSPRVCASPLKFSLLVSLALLSCALGGWRFVHTENILEKQVERISVEEEIMFRGVIVSDRDERDTVVKYVVEVSSMAGYEDETVDGVRILVTAPMYPHVVYGDEVTVKGFLMLPTNFTSDVGRSFDYVSYLRKDKISFVVFRPTVERLSEGNAGTFQQYLFRLKYIFLESVSQVIPEPEVSLLGGLIVGAKQSLGENLLEDFRRVGLIHIVVLSGYNVTIVAEAVARTLLFMSPIYRAALSIFGIASFTLMTGASATIVRASIMASIVVTSRVVGREFDVTRALLFAGFVMVLHNPYVLIYDPSFQLSFIAMIGLVYVSPVCETWFSFVTQRWGLRSLVAATVSTQIFVLPLLLYMVGSVSLVALPVNFLVLLCIPLTMLLGFITGMFGLVSSVLALPFGMLTYALLYYELVIVKVFALLPFASVEVGVFPFWVVLVWYGVYVYVLHKKFFTQTGCE